jgi:ABC-type glutathione transport system ATPase component
MSEPTAPTPGSGSAASAPGHALAAHRVKPGPTASHRNSGGGAAAAGPVIQVTNVVRDYHRPRTSLLRPAPVVHALRGVSLEVQAGERFGIVGESGCGKSTLLRIIAALDRATSGQVVVEGTDITRLPERRLKFLRENLQLVFQDPMSSLDPRMRVRDIIAEPLVVQGHPASGERVRELLDAVGLSADAGDRYPHQFSGGQRQRISIARALAPRPRILIADEPVSALDVSVRAQVLNLISDLVDELNLTLIFVSHDLSVIKHVCDRVAVMNAGEIVETGPTGMVYATPTHPYTRRLVSSIPTLPRALAGATTSDLLKGDSR